jgi:hypothetical protein
LEPNSKRKDGNARYSNSWKTGTDNSQFWKWTNWFAIIRPAVSSCSSIKVCEFTNKVSVCYNSLTKFIFLLGWSVKCSCSDHMWYIQRRSGKIQKYELILRPS